MRLSKRMCFDGEFSIASATVLIFEIDIDQLDLSYKQKSEAGEEYQKSGLIMHSVFFFLGTL